MFDYMLESSPVKRARQSPWAYLISLTIQTLMIGVMILIPLLYTEALPQTMLSAILVAPPPPPPPPPPPAAVQPVKRIKRVSLMEAGKLRAPREIPKEIAIIKDDPIPVDEGAFGVVGGVPGGVPGGQMSGVIGGVLGGIPSAAPPPPTPTRIRVSTGVQEAKLIRKIQPNYPPIAKQARIQGTVQLEALISREGSIQNLRVLDGHPLLAQAAVEAVQQWRYEPTLLNNEPVEVVTIIHVIFKLN
ncbi:MAG: energy transducer TonB [Candidatus Acidiferrales bacterium]